MPKNFILILTLITIVAFIFRYFFYYPQIKKISVNIKGKNYILEIAKTYAQKSKGLMNRKSLCNNCGMIFISSIEMPQIFWMKNTLIPLDIIFIDKNRKIVNMVTAKPPPPHTPDSQLILYQSDRPAKYVIELNAGDINILNLKSNDQINLPQI